MRRTIATAITVLTLAACSPYDTPADATPAPTTRPQHPATTCDRACWHAVKLRQQNERLWWAEVVRQQHARAAWARLTAHVEAQRRASAYRPGQCGGSLPPCYVMRRESGGNIRIWNGGCYAPVGWRGKSPCGTSSASGKWQAIRSSWGGFGGYVNAADAPESVQDAWARRLYAGGRGGSHWGL